MTPRAALRAALRATGREWPRLLAANAAFSAAVLAILLAASYVQAALALVVLLGPLAAGLMHMAVVLTKTGSVRLADGLAGLRIHWKRGLQLGAFAAVAIVFGLKAVSFYAHAGGVFVSLGFVTVYLLAVFGAFQLVLWPVAITDAGSLGHVLSKAALVLMRRPFAVLGLASALAVIGAVATATILPLLSIAIAYVCLAAAYFTLPTTTPGNRSWQE